MTTHNKISQLKQQSIIQHKQACNSHSFFNLLTSDELLSTLDELLPEHRERTYPPTETLSMFLAQALNDDRSCQNIVNEAAVNKVAMGLSPMSTRTGGYCRARQRLPLELISSLVRETGALASHQIPDEWLWKGRKVKLIDGTTAAMPDTPANQHKYPQPDSQKPGLGFPMCRLLGVICLSSGMLLNADICPYQGKGSDEHTMLRTMIDTFDAGDLLVGDAYFGSYFMLVALIERGVDAVFEQFGARRRTVDFSKGVRVGSKDHIVELKKPKKKPSWMSIDVYQQAPDTIKIRELKVDKKLIITTLLSPKEATKTELKSLYKQRWHVELDIRNIKTTMGMAMLSCRSPKMVEKEIWIYFLAYNLIRLLMAQTALLADILPRKLSFKHTVQLWLAWSKSNTYGANSKSNDVLFALISQHIVGNRPNRIEPRSIKKRPKHYPNLLYPRQQSRDYVKKYGHPHKIK